MTHSDKDISRYPEIRGGCSDDDSNSNLPAKKRGGAITQPSYQLNTFHHAMNVYYDSLSLSISFSPQLKTCHQAEKTHKNKST